MIHKPATLAASIIFGVVAVAHLARSFAGISIIIGGWAVPKWISVVGLLGAAALAVLLWMERAGKW